LVVCVFFMILSTIALVLRLWTRRIIQVQLGVDDWLIAISVFIFWGFCANILVGVYTIGGGETYADPSEEEQKMVQYLQSEYSIFILYALNVTLIKLSILFLYLRIFGTVNSFRRLAYIILTLCLLWCTAAMISNILYCIPIRKFWDPTVQGSCFNFPIFYLIVELIDILLDVIIIGLPLKTILGLQLSVHKKLALLGIFVLGILVIVTSAVRIGYVYKPDHQLLDLGQASLWSVINLGVAILCACLPTYAPLFGRFASLGKTHRSVHTSDISTHDSDPRFKSGNSDEMLNGCYYQMNDSNRDNIALTQHFCKGERDP